MGLRARRRAGPAGGAVSGRAHGGDAGHLQFGDRADRLFRQCGPHPGRLALRGRGHGAEPRRRGRLRGQWRHVCRRWHRASMAGRWRRCRRATRCCRCSAPWAWRRGRAGRSTRSWRSCRCSMRWPIGCRMCRASAAGLSSRGWRTIRAFAEAFFAPHGIAGLSTIDGLQFRTRSGDMVHFRASGNAPELRCYVEGSSPEVAQALLDWAMDCCGQTGRLKQKGRSKAAPFILISRWRRW